MKNTETTALMWDRENMVTSRGFSGQYPTLLEFQELLFFSDRSNMMDNLFKWMLIL